jgi:hypothetical protein
VPKAPDATAEADAATTSHDAVVGGGAG